MLPTIFTAFLYCFLYHFLSFPAFHAFSIYFSKSFTRLLQFPIVFAPFPLVCCIFNIFFQAFYPSPSVSDRFCTISSGCYRIFLHFHCLFPACLLHRHSLFLAVAPVSSMFQQILHGLFLAFSSDRYPAFLKFHCIFQYILFVGFQYVLSSIFLLHVSYHFHLFPPIGFCTISSGFLHFHTFSILILIQEFYLSPSFSDPFCTISYRCYHIFLHFHCIFPACLLHRHGLHLAFAGFLHFPRDFPWFVPSIRSVFVRFPGDFVRFSLIVIMFPCSFIVFSNTSSWSLRPPKRRT